ncbi:Lrp/AsnC family transcriptional regulator [Hansschlegelia quercus]|nr:Lrp/AsnC family transcriptional regulator [Hansschlegelia quercus]
MLIFFPARLDSARQSLRAASAGDLSETDLKLIKLLQADGRAPFVQLAREVGATEKTVRRRVQELRDRKIMEITAVADPLLLGYRSTAFVGLKLDKSAQAAEVARDIFAIPQVDYAVVTTGRYDLVVEALCREEKELLELMETQLRTRAAVRHIEVFPILKLHYQLPDWNAAQRKTSPSPARTAEIDEGDLAIIRELSFDGRASFAQIAERTGLSEPQVSRRHDRLVADGVMRVVGITNPRSLGFNTLAWLAIRAAPGVRISDLADRLNAIPSIAYVVVAAGRFDLFAEVVCADQTDLLRLLDNDVRPQPDIQTAEALLCLDLYYRRVMPAASPSDDLEAAPNPAFI